MNILVTGGAGYIGSHVVRKLLKCGYLVTVLDNLSTGFAESLPERVCLIQGDVLNTSLLVETIQDYEIGAVIHFAAKLIVPESIQKPTDYYENNTVGVLSLIKACKATQLKKIVFSSTAAVYGNADGVELLSESSPTGPLNPYGHSKLMSEQMLLDADVGYDIKTICLRYFNVAGASLDQEVGQRTRNATHLIKVACEAALGIRPSIGIFGKDYPTHDGTGVRDYIHVEDLADLHCLALRHLESDNGSQVLNCGYGQGYSVLEVIEMVRRISNSTFKVKFEPRRGGDAACMVANSDKIKKLFGWEPKCNSLELICRSAYEWERKVKNEV